MPPLPDVAAVTVIQLPVFRQENGDLLVVEANHHFPLAIARVFSVRAAEGAVRGRHAHKACTQMMVCVNGAIDVFCDDGHTTKTITLDRPDIAALVPPGIWAEETYRTSGAILTVFCDRPYEVDDYIRDYDAFKAYRAGGAR